MHIGKRIKQAMLAKKVGTKAMADACGVTPGAVSNWFSSGTIAKANLATAARVLGTSVEELITGQAEPRPAPTIPGASYEGIKLATWLDKITDEQSHLVAYAAAMEQILRVLNGLPPLPIPSPNVRDFEETPPEPHPARPANAPSRKRSGIGLGGK